MKQVQLQLYPPEWPLWHGDIEKHWSSPGVFIVNFEKMPHLFLVFDCWIRGSIAGWVYQQISNCRQLKNAKHASAGTNYAILTKRVKVQHEKKSVKSMEIVGFGQTSTKFIEIFVP